MEGGERTTGRRPAGLTVAFGLERLADGAPRKGRMEASLQLVRRFVAVGWQVRDERTQVCFPVRELERHVVECGAASSGVTG